ncbi:S26 family signal peptidase [Halococcoides cellulosivorans]|uniref:S26 family signal peptidase n=1 Tax=Halococcoides cellulosivorans TaxID=1679096 RepID=UPI001F1FDDA5|nr:S26 family signal peptidase [Halococcoides cellulosivorans]
MVYDLFSAVGIVVFVVAFLLAISGIWPPLVAIESGSMSPHIQKGDLAFVMEESRFPGENAVAGTGVVTHETGQEGDYRSFQRSGDVIVYQPNGNAEKTPIIHRAMMYVEEGENWYDRANGSWIGGADGCEDLSTCPAPHDGFITGGDSNGYYDQKSPSSLSTVVKPEWVVGRAMGKIPHLGKIRLRANALGREFVGA